MDAQKLLTELQAQLPGHKLMTTRLAANSLILYLFKSPGDATNPVQPLGYSIWLESTWHISYPTGILTGSRQAQGTDPTLGATHEELDHIHTLITPVRHLPVTNLHVDPRGHDFTLTLVNEEILLNRDPNTGKMINPPIPCTYLIRTFVTDPTDEFSWSITDHDRDLVLKVSPNGLTLYPVTYDPTTPTTPDLHPPKESPRDQAADQSPFHRNPKDPQVPAAVLANPRTGLGEDQ